MSELVHPRHPREERTLLLVKPDGVKRGLTGEIIRRIEMRGFKIIGLAMVWATREQIEGHYDNSDAYAKSLAGKTKATYEKYGIDVKAEMGTDDDLEIGRMVRSWLVEFMLSGPIMKVAIKGVHVVEGIRKLCGHTMPALAEMGTIRGDFSTDSAACANRDHRTVRNLAHASGTPEEAEKELAYWFSEKELHDYKRAEEDVMY
ncbi:MAG: nucleoside-diphosphate kinase [bacterium]|nr:nucleoside-diphosphate kinase [bacterium]